MAEIVATGMGIATFGITASKLIVEFRELWSSAPKDLSQIIERGTRLSTILASVKTKQAEFAPLITPSPVWDVCTQHCESAARELEETAKSLRDCMQKSKVRGTVKTILKKGLIAKLQQDLDRAERDLMFAQNWWVTVFTLLGAADRKI